MANQKKDNPNDNDNSSNAEPPVTSDTDDSLEFLPPMSPSLASMSNIVNPQNVARAARVANSLRSGDISSAAAEAGISEASDLIRDIQNIAGTVSALKDTIKVIKGADNSGISGGGNNIPGDNQGSVSNSYLNATRLNLDIAPTEVRFNTGIKPDAYSPSYHTAEDNISPLHINFGRLELPQLADTTSTVTRFFSSAILFELRNIIQRNITFSPNANLITDAALAGAFNAVLYALTIYYQVTRYIVYGNDPMNQNEGLLFIRSTLNTSAGDSYLTLRRLLQGLPIPPNMNMLAFYINQVYLSSELPGSPAIMFCSHGLVGTTVNWTAIDTAISGLTGTVPGTSPAVNCNDVLALIGRAIPSWYATQLYTGISNPLHDPGFASVWTNAPFSVAATTPVINQLGPSVTSGTQDISYNAWTNNLDGAMYALTSTYNTTVSRWQPSLFSPLVVTISGNQTSRVSWFRTAGVSQFVNAIEHDSCAFARDETYTASLRFSNGVNRALNYGAERVYGVNTVSIANTSLKLLDWMFSWNTITTKKDKSLEGNGPLNPAVGKYTGSDSVSNKPMKRKRKGKGGKRK
jgi:hypothetical protein